VREAAPTLTDAPRSKSRPEKQKKRHLMKQVTPSCRASAGRCPAAAAAQWKCTECANRCKPCNRASASRRFHQIAALLRESPLQNDTPAARMTGFETPARTTPEVVETGSSHEDENAEESLLARPASPLISPHSRKFSAYFFTVSVLGRCPFR